MLLVRDSYFLAMEIIMAMGRRTIGLINVIIYDICRFRSASLLVSSLQGVVNCLKFISGAARQPFLLCYTVAVILSNSVPIYLSMYICPQIFPLAAPSVACLKQRTAKMQVCLKKVPTLKLSVTLSNLN